MRILGEEHPQVEDAKALKLEPAWGAVAGAECARSGQWSPRPQWSQELGHLAFPLIQGHGFHSK